MRAERASSIAESKAKYPRNLGGAGPKLSEMRAKFRNEIWAGPKRNSGLGQARPPLIPAYKGRFFPRKHKADKFGNTTILAYLYACTVLYDDRPPNLSERGT